MELVEEAQLLSSMAVYLSERGKYQQAQDSFENVLERSSEVLTHLID